VTEEQQPDVNQQQQPSTTFPVPTVITWSATTLHDNEGNGHLFIVMKVNTPVGSQTYYLPPENAHTMCDGIKKTLATMPLEPSPRSRLIVPEFDPKAVQEAVAKNGNQIRRQQ
jgi:hypothetical protein